jgi:hypothetical protein
LSRAPRSSRRRHHRSTRTDQSFSEDESDLTTASMDERPRPKSGNRRTMSRAPSNRRISGFFTTPRLPTNLPEPGARLQTSELRTTSSVGGEDSGEGNPVATDPLPSGAAAHSLRRIPQRDGFISHQAAAEAQAHHVGLLFEGEALNGKTVLATAAAPTRHRRGPTRFRLYAFGALFLSGFADSPGGLLTRTEPQAPSYEGAAVLCTRGSVIVKIAPRPGSDSTSRLPPMRPTSSREM